MTGTDFSAWCAQGPRFLDGATGTNLMKAGLPRGCCAEAWVLEHPEVIQTLQQAYVRAGSQLVYAPTFCANRSALAGFGLQDRMAEMNRELVRLSRQAVGPDVLVAGDMTTLGRPVEPEGPNSFDALLEVYREQAQALAEAGVDLFAIETMMGLQETLAAAEAVKSVCDLPILCTFSFQSDGRCYFDGDAAEAAATLEALGVDAVGVNCSSGPDQLESVVRTLRSACSLPLAAKPNAGLPTISDDGTAVYTMNAVDFAAHMKVLADAGASLLGGCCGTTPEYIRILKDTL